MSYGPDLDHLAARWAEHPEGTAFAALADGLRKRGVAEEAEAVVRRGLARHPEHLPGHLVLAALRRDAGDAAGAERALQEALRLDPAHPVVLAALADLAEAAGRTGEARAWREAERAAVPDGSEPPTDASADFAWDEAVPSDEEEGGEGEHDLPLTESLAALYHRQGHLERAAEVYEALARRRPDDPSLAARRDEVRAELGATRPRPFSAVESGGVPLTAWLARVAADQPAPGAATGFDAFYQAPPAAPRGAEDLDAFQHWLRGLGR